MKAHGAHLLWRVCRLPCMFPGICPCSPCDRASPRDSDSTLGSMTALLSRWWVRAAPPERNTRDSQKHRPNVRNKSCVCVWTYKTAWVRLPVFCELFTRCVSSFGWSLQRLWCWSLNRSARTVRNFARAPPPRALCVALSVKFKRLLAALFTPHWHRVSQSALRSLRWRHAFVQSQSARESAPPLAVHSRRQTDKLN